jgi:hypothetical protein
VLGLEGESRHKLQRYDLPSGTNNKMFLPRSSIIALTSIPSTGCILHRQREAPLLDLKTQSLPMSGRSAVRCWVRRLCAQKDHGGCYHLRSTATGVNRRILLLASEAEASRICRVVRGWRPRRVDCQTLLATPFMVKALDAKLLVVSYYRIALSPIVQPGRGNAGSD